MIGLISGSPLAPSDWGDRFDAVKEEAGTTAIFTNTSAADWSAESGRMAFTTLWSRSPRPSAIFAGNDYLAAGAIHKGSGEHRTPYPA